VGLAPAGALCLLHDDDVEDFPQLVVQPVHLIDGGWGQHVQGCGYCSHVLASPSEGGALPLLAANGRSHPLGLGSSGCEVHHEDPL
jgi:hypothetical protein